VSELSSNDLEAIADLHNRWLEAERSGNSLAVLRFCTDDVVWMPPDSTILEGKEAITRWMKYTNVEIKSLELTDIRIDGSGTVAYKTANYSTAYLAEGDSEVSRVKGSHLWILKKFSHGDWRVAIVTWSSVEAN
jgi:uncharacterized protein (TIGR02246 family)